jgi:hypothetical protein
MSLRLVTSLDVRKFNGLTTRYTLHPLRGYNIFNLQYMHWCQKECDATFSNLYADGSAKRSCTLRNRVCARGWLCSTCNRIHIFKEAVTNERAETAHWLRLLRLNRACVVEQLCDKMCSLIVQCLIIKAQIKIYFGHLNIIVHFWVY